MVNLCACVALWEHLCELDRSVCMRGNLCQRKAIRIKCVRQVLWVICVSEMFVCVCTFICIHMYVPFHRCVCTLSADAEDKDGECF